MKKIYSIFRGNITVFGLAFFLCADINSSNAQSVYSNYQDGKIYLKLKDNISLDIAEENGRVSIQDAFFIRDLVDSYHIISIRKPFFKTHSEILQRTYEIKFSDFPKVDALIEELSKNSIIEYAEKVPLHKTDYTPNDPSYSSQQWYLPLIHASAAWDVSKGSKSIVVAIVDNAVSITHPDLAANIWVNPDEIPNNGIDDDGDGYIDDVNGYDVADNDNDPNPPSSSFSHGTHVAGIVGAVSDNSIGIASIGFNISIMAVKAQINSGSSTGISDGFAGITFAADAGANVINCSWGGGGSSSTEQNVVNYAFGKGCVLVFAAGNNGSSSLFYPAAYNNAISVASTTNTDVKSSFSDYGTWVDISAPGSSIYSTVTGNTYTTMSGTSMASPLVAGLCGLMLSACPSLSNVQVETCLKSSADNIDAKNASYIGKLGAGRINAENAVKCAATFLTAPPVAAFTSDVNSTCTGVVNFKDNSTYAPSSWKWNFGDNSTSSLQNPAHTYTSNGTYTVKLTVTNANGSDSLIKTSFIIVNKPSVPNVTPASRCDKGVLNLGATASAGGTLNWYDSITGGTLVNTGVAFSTPVLNATKTYYVEEVVSSPSQKVGPVDNTFGTGGYFTSNSDRRNYFDVYTACILKTVKVYANTSGNRTIEVRDAGGVLKNTLTVNIPAGQSRVTLNFNLNPGTGYYIKCNGTVDLYRNNAGASFPYTLPGVLSITETDASTPGYYYFFYDWEVAKAPCISPRAPITATILLSTPAITQNGSLLTSSFGNSYQWYLNGNLIPGASTQTYVPTQTGTYTVEVTSNGCTIMSTPLYYIDVGISSAKISGLKIFPNPVTETLEVSGFIPGHERLSIEMTNMIGEKIWMKESGEHLPFFREEIDMRNIIPGIYFLRIINGSQSLVRKIVKD